MTLATADERGRPSARIVLLKGVDERGLTFFTNYGSRKGRDLAARPYAALVLFWEPLHRQIRVEGTVERVAIADSDAYFASRARGSQIGAWASTQGRPMAQPGDLDERIVETEQRFAGKPVTRPPYWSGFRIVPARIEFWKNMPSRLHVRHLYTRTGGEWGIQHLYP
jgi:pyridoxamine 5'-phosphate oxidase